MARAPLPAPLRRAASPIGPRRRYRPWTRPNDLGSSMTLLAVIPSLPRATLARLTEAMIDRMDEIDGDTELELNGDEMDGDNSEDEFLDRYDGLSLPGVPEDAEDDDPAGDPLDERGEFEDWRPDGVAVDRPRYGEDQSTGPLNELEAYRNWHRAIRAR